jgi:hypothetical protein
VNLFINAAICPDDHLIEALHTMKEGEALLADQLLIAARLSESDAREFSPLDTEKFKRLNTAKSLFG